ncbi:DinB family protein [soil metagenome]
MNYSSIDEIYAANDATRIELITLLGAVTAERESVIPTGEIWSVAHNAEHVQIVEYGMFRICSKLLGEAEKNGELSDGKILISDSMIAGAEVLKTKKNEAPDRVKPTGLQNIAGSIEKMHHTRQQLNDLRPRFETYDGNRHKFPHPFFGHLSAIEWLILIGFHESRHIAQIRRIVASL